MIDSLRIAMPEMCALFIAMVVIVSTPDKLAGERRQNRIIVKYERALILSLVFSIGRYFTSGLLSFVLEMLFHAAFGVVCCIAAIYTITLFPNAHKRYYTYKKVFIIIYSVYGALLITSPLTHLVYYYRDGVTVKGPLWFMAYVVGGLMILKTFHFLVTEDIPNHVLGSIITMIPCMLVPSLVTLWNNDAAFTGLGTTSALILILNMFHGGRFDTETGVENPLLIGRELRRLKKKPFCLLIFTFDKKGLEAREGTKVAADAIRELTAAFQQAFTFSSVFDTGRSYMLLVETGNINRLRMVTEEITSLFEGRIPALKTCCVEKRMVPEVDQIKYIPTYDKWHMLDEEDIKNMRENRLIHRAVRDICGKRDPVDSRIILLAQPIYDRKKKMFLTAEILCRMRIRNIKSIVKPCRFMPIIEENGFLHDFNLIMLEKACRLVRKIDGTGIPFEGVSVNFSPEEVIFPEFTEDVMHVLNKYGTDPSRIHIELTESSTVEDMRLLCRRVETLQRLGFKIYLDDFGTGYSNLIELVKIPFDVIKFDKSLVDEAICGDHAMTILRRLSETFAEEGYSILYEGVEDWDGQRMSERNDVDYIQGFRYSRPMTGAKLIGFLSKQNTIA